MPLISPESTTNIKIKHHSFLILSIVEFLQVRQIWILLMETFCQVQQLMAPIQ